MFRFMTNPSTSAPLTFALEGGWGKGKSSAMRVLQTKLEAQNYPTVWFNAWHHQKEEHLFASLMEEVRANAVPGPSKFGFLQPRNLLVRARLFLSRFRARPLRYALIALIAAFLFSLTFQISSLDAKYRDSAALISGFGALGGLFLSLRLMRDLTATFKASPAVLLNMSRMMFSPGRFQDRLSFRDQFAEAFGEVTRALGRRRLTIFIDDLDRCGQRQVVEMLEAVNFLVSSGECYVVMGLARKPVEVAIGLQFDALAKATADADVTRTAADEQREFAEHYLEKMINLSIKIPAFDSGALKELIDRAEGGIVRPPFWARMRPMLRLTAAALITVAAMWAGWQLSQREGLATTVGCQTVLDPESKPCVPPKSETKEDQGKSQTDENDTSGATQTTGTPAPATGFRTPLLALFGLLLALAMFIPRRSRKYLSTFDPEQETKGESAAFRNAIRACLPLLLTDPETNYPRALKRFVNLMRFMTANIPDDEDSRMLGIVLLGAMAELSTASAKPSPDQIKSVLKATDGTLTQKGLQTAIDQSRAEFTDLSAMIRFSGGARSQKATTK
ncbi:MAG: KAP family P-loop NTPase fold protein [Pikeienuella sp.]